MPSMHNLDELLNRVKERVADPLRFLDSAAWVRPLQKMGAPAALEDVERAERLVGFSFPNVIRRMYTEVGNGGWGHTMASIQFRSKVPSRQRMIWWGCT